ncbi:MAG: DNA-3-methyladenine glycosylase I [Chloroflexi bacterium]|nr:DNA-3-methyladenine glycosylase I [Chloroflexota bacterium]
MHTAPARIEPTSLADYLEALSKATFQPGMSWRVVDAKWPGIKAAFRNFDPIAVAAFGEPELDALTNDPSVIRSRKKLEAVVHNARRMLELEGAYGSFRAYLRAQGGFEQTVAHMRKQFKFLGDMGAFHFLYVVGEEVPSYDEWCATHGQHS